VKAPWDVHSFAGCPYSECFRLDSLSIDSMDLDNLPLVLNSRSSPERE
jgi:hypothetical protein